jgi:hypothetical protein
MIPLQFRSSKCAYALFDIRPSVTCSLTLHTVVCLFLLIKLPLPLPVFKSLAHLGNNTACRQDTLRSTFFIC